MGQSAEPKVTFGLPVYNSELLIGRAIDSVLAQTVSDIELIVSDNCSTDSTPDIVQRYSQNDARVRYSKTHENVGAARNFSRLVPLARGQYFRWLSHDDWIAPHFVERCLQAAEGVADVSTVAPTLTVVDQHGELQQRISSYIGRSGFSHNRLDQYRQMMKELAYCETHDDGLIMCSYVNGLHRLEALKKTRLLLPFISSDYVLAAELALAGRIIDLPEPDLSFYTISTHNTGTSANFSNWRPDAIQRMLAPSQTTRMDLMLSVRRRHIEHVNAVMRSELGLRDKLLALEAAIRPMWARAAKRVGVGSNGASS